MVQLFPTPQWFQGFDLAFEAIIFLVALVIAGYSWRVYQLSKERRFQFFSLAFLLISFSLLIKLITSSAIYFSGVRVAADVFVRPAFGAAREYSIFFYRLGFFTEMAALLGGWLLIFFISQKARERLKKVYELSQIGLFIFFVLLVSWVANFQYVVFYLTSAVLLGLIVINYYQNYLNNENKNTYKVMVAFLLILFAHILFTFIFALPELYVIGQLLLLLGFIILLYTYAKTVYR